MKKNLLLRLCLILGVAFAISSCRTDHLTENETFNNSSKFQLTSKRISLDEAKHKSILLPELEKAEAAFKNSKTNVNGRVIDYGNGVSIDTDEVIYIENGPNYHTYTFHIKRENAPETAPLENLLLVPLPDGKYNEFLITYNLTPAERERLKAGLPVDTNGKSQVTELANGTFNGSNQLARLSCFNTSQTYWAPCSENLHNGSNYAECEFVTNPKNGTPPTQYTVVTHQCIEQNDDIITPIDPGGGGGGGGGTSEPPVNNNPPCTGTTIPTNPQPGFTDENGCPISAPTLPNLPVRNNPCEKAKKTTDLTEYKTNITYLKGKIGQDHEFGRRLGNPDPTTAQSGIQNDELEGISGTNFIRFNTNQFTFALMHCHYDSLYPIFSPQDIIFFNNWINGAIAYNNNPTSTPKINIKELSITAVTVYGSYLISFDGTSADPFPNFTQEQLDELEQKYKTELNKAKINLGYDTDKLEREFLEFVKKYLNMPGLKLYKVESTGNTEIYLENGNRKTKKCP